MASLKHLSLAALAGLASGNFVSPGLKKCLTIGPVDAKDASKHAAVLIACTKGAENQNFGLLDGSIQSTSGMCLQADAGVANSWVQLADCKMKQNLLQQWDLTEHGYIKLRGTKQCLDVRAELKTDGTREVWHEIKAHDSVRLHVYDCHDFCTSRVNQLWSWAPITGDLFGVANVLYSKLGPIAGNIVSPGLAKCLDVGGDKTWKALSTTNRIDVQLATCTDEFNQNFEIVDGEIKVPSLGKCIVAQSLVSNANILLAECTQTQKWYLDRFGHVKLEGTNLCMDVTAQLKSDRTRETQMEIKAHDRVNVQLHTCHDLKTDRVNQMWEWSPITPGSMAVRKECPAGPKVVAAPLVVAAHPVVAAPLVVAAPTGSMVSDVNQAKELARTQMGLLNNYSLLRVKISAATPVVSVASIALLIVAAAVAFARRRFAPGVEEVALISSEE